MISAVVLTRNEENTIVDCLESLSWVKDIVVVDDYSTDRTIDLAKRFGAKIYVRELANDFSEQRNFGLSKAQNDWVLLVDADERVTEDLKNEIIYRLGKLKRESTITGFTIRRKDFLFGKKLLHGETGNISFVRLGQKSKGVWKGKVHEEWHIRGKIDHLESDLLHFPHNTLHEFLTDINYYTDLRSRELYMQGMRVTWFDIVFLPLGKFIFNYFLKRGFLDGEEGVILGFIMSFHSFLVRSKLWLLWQKN